METRPGRKESHSQLCQADLRALREEPSIWPYIVRSSQRRSTMPVLIPHSAQTRLGCSR